MLALAALSLSRPPGNSDPFSLSFSRSHLLTSSTHHGSMHPQPSPSGTPRTVEEEEEEGRRDGVTLTEQIESSKLVEERDKLASRVQELQSQLASMVGESEARETESRGFEVMVEEGLIVQEREKEFSDKIQQLQVQLSTIIDERDHLREELEAQCQEREKEGREFAERLCEKRKTHEELETSVNNLHLEKIALEAQLLASQRTCEQLVTSVESLQEGKAIMEAQLQVMKEEERTREQLETRMESLRQDKAALEEQLQVMKGEAVEKERRWEEERHVLAEREAEMLQAMEDEKQRALMQCEELKQNCTELRRQFEKSEEIVIGQKSVLEDRNAEIDSVNEARLKLEDDCKKLEDSLEKKRTEIKSLQQHNMQWRGESEKKGQEIESLQTAIKDLNVQIQDRNNRYRYQSLGSDVRSGSLSTSRSMSSEGCRSDREQLQQHQVAALRVQTEHQKSSESEFESKELELIQRRQQIEQLKSEYDALREQKEKVDAELSQIKSQLVAEKANQEAERSELKQLCERLEARLREAERQCKELQLQAKEEKTKCAADIARLNYMNERLQSQLSNEQKRTDKLNSELDQLREQLKQVCTQEELSKSKLDELEAENELLHKQKDSVIHELEQLRLKVKENEENSCLECEKHLIDIATLKQTLDEKEEELKRSEYRHQQAQMAYTSSKAQQEQLRLRLVALEKKREKDASEMSESLEGKMEEREVGTSGGGGSVKKKSELDKGESFGVKEEDREDDGWVLEGGDDKGMTLQDEVKRLRTELAVERKNRSLLAEELVHVGRERDQFMQKFMEIERELRSHHRSSVFDSVMTASSSSAGSSGAGRGGTTTASGQQKKLSLTISK